jgi:type I restriction enzyme, R subunit
MENSKKSGLPDNAISDTTALLNASTNDNLDIHMELEKTTRERIDKRLSHAGWDTADASLVKQEIDTKNSDFKKKDYKTRSETINSKGEKAYADYILLDSVGLPLAVVEAKRTSKDARTGQKQAEDYAQDIHDQIDSNVLIYFTNGTEIWFYNKGYTNPRKVLGFHSRDDLERQIYQNKNKKNLLEIPIRDEIINRPYQIEAVVRVSEGIENLAKRKFLIVQATGTGKTRVSMGLIDRMLKSKRAQRILFLVDRDELRTQAFDENIVKFFPSESKQKIVSKKVNTDSRIYVSTLQTMENVYKEFSIGFFDVIISDEAHRSIFNKFKNIFQYFDSVQIGLTATPADMVLRDTYDFFDCEDGVPTSSFSYEEAVPQYLVPFKQYPALAHFQIEGIRSKDIPDEEKNRLLAEEGIEENELNFSGSEIEKKVSVTGTNKAWLKEFMENCLIDETGLPCKTIIFPTSIKHGRIIVEEFEKAFPQHKGEMIKLISSDDSKSRKLIKEFKTNSLPRIAVSVGILDTGVDIPEVCNLIFARPTKSKIRFWQMLGRGTRHESTCEHKDWLPVGGKKYFMAFDYMNNFEFFKMKPKGDIPTPIDAISVRVLLTKLKQYETKVNNNG